MVARSSLRRLLPKRVARHRIRFGPLRGLYLHASWHNYPRAILGRAEPDLLAWFAEHVAPGETWLDVGAHYGYTSLALCRRVGERGRVFAFEPTLATAGCLAQTRSSNRLAWLSVVPVGLGEGPAGFTRPYAMLQGMAHIAGGSGDTREDAGANPVLLTALDDIWLSLCAGDPAVHGIKIDVQGMEASTLRGMRATLREQRPKLVVEFHRYADLDGMIATLEQAGYDPRGEPLEGADREPTRDYRHAVSYRFRPA